MDGCFAVALAVGVACSGCGSDNNSGQVVTPTSTVTARPTATPIPSATPTPAEEGPELKFGSTGPGSGSLSLASDDDRTVKVFATDIPGVFIGTDPGFPTIEANDPQQPLYTLNEGTQVSLLVKAIDDGVTVMFGDMALDRVGESVVLGNAPLHADGSWQVSFPTAVPPTNRSVTLQLTTTSGAYKSSAPFTLTLVPTEEEGG